MSYGSRNSGPFFAPPPLLAAPIENGLARALGVLLLFWSSIAWLSLATWVFAPPANALGAFGAFFADAIAQSMGASAPLALLALGWCGLELVSTGRMGRAGARIASMAAAIVPLAGALSAAPLGETPALAHGPGGILGELVLDWASRLFAPLGPDPSSAIAGLLCLICGTRAAAHGLGFAPFNPGDSAARLREALSLLWLPGLFGAPRAAEDGEASPELEFDAESRAIARRFAPASAARRSRHPPRRPAKPAPAGANAESRESAQPRRQSQDASIGGAERARLEALREHSERNSRLLEKALAGLGVAGQIGAGASGPVFTVYEFEPARAVDPSRLADLSLGVARVSGLPPARIAASPGRTALSIELPNGRRAPVFLRDLLRTRAFRQSRARLPIAIGVAADGAPIVADLARLGHVAILGAPGSGKSTGLHAVALSLIHQRAPASCQLVLIAPNASGFALYEGVPHLAGPIAADAGQAEAALAWAASEMNRRLLRMAKLETASVEEFNSRVDQAAARGEKLARVVETGFDPVTGEARRELEILPFEPMPRIVLLIDGLAELTRGGAKIALPLAKIARSGAAAGIHLVMTAETSPGCLPAHVSARLCFKVSSRRESRVILDEAGAEMLLGDGDMLLSQGFAPAMRLQGPFVSRSDIAELPALFRAPPRREQRRETRAAAAGSGLARAA